MIYVNANNYLRHGKYFENSLFMLGGSEYDEENDLIRREKYIISEGTFRICPNILKLILIDVNLGDENCFNFFTSLSNLTYLSIIDFKFTFNKKFIRGLEKLKTLDLRSGKVELEDDFFSDNPEMKKIIFSDIGLTKFNENMIRGTKIEDIFIHFNNDYKVISQNSFTLPSILNLQLGCNKIEKIEDGSFSEKINSIHLRNNNLTNVSHIFFPSVNLLDLSGNKLLEVDDIEELNKKIKKLYI